MLGVLFVVRVDDVGDFSSSVLIVYFFPKGYKFKYDIDKNSPWPYEDYFAPFDYSILKSNEELNQEKEDIKSNKGGSTFGR